MSKYKIITAVHFDSLYEFRAKDIQWELIAFFELGQANPEARTTTFRLDKDQVYIVIYYGPSDEAELDDQEFKACLINYLGDEHDNTNTSQSHSDPQLKALYGLRGVQHDPNNIAEIDQHIQRRKAELGLLID